jgi:hypothetical protein
MGTTAALLAGCRGGTEPTVSGTAPELPADATYAHTALRASGNRVLDGSGQIGSTPVTLSTDGTPAWLLAFEAGEASHWLVVTDDGTATSYRIEGDDSERIVTHGTVSTPPLGYRADDEVGVVEAPTESETVPVVHDDGLLYVATSGDVVHWRGEDRERLSIDAPADARLVAIDSDRYACYGRRADWYDHGALGDSIEGSSLVVVDAAADRVATEVKLDAPTVFEGLSPLVADLNGDGDDEIVTTVADSEHGAQIRVYGTDGRELATGPVWGPGWRHQLCIAPFAPDDGPELAVVRKPHVDRTVEFYRLDGGELTVTATLTGFSTHTYGSRNVDQALAGDLDGDGRTELLLPTTERTALAIVRRTAGGAETIQSLPLGGRLTTNVTGVAHDGGVTLGAGTVDGVRLWRG